MNDFTLNLWLHLLRNAFEKCVQVLKQTYSESETLSKRGRESGEIKLWGRVTRGGGMFAHYCTVKFGADAGCAGHARLVPPPSPERIVLSSNLKDSYKEKIVPALWTCSGYCHTSLWWTRQHAAFLDTNNTTYMQQSRPPSDPSTNARARARTHNIPVDFSVHHSTQNIDQLQLAFTHTRARTDYYKYHLCYRRSNGNCIQKTGFHRRLKIKLSHNTMHRWAVDLHFKLSISPDDTLHNASLLSV